MRNAHRSGWTVPVALLVIWLMPEAVHAAGQDTAGWGERFWGWWDRLLRQLTEPLFWFGIGAQAMFFMRFFWQWIVSERRHHSTVPIAFWYFSLAGGAAMFIYACLRADLVIMLGQALACLIYARNLMLIYGQATRRRRAGLPAGHLRSAVDGENGDHEDV